MSDLPKHPLKKWMDERDPPLRAIVAAQRLGVSESFLSQVLRWQRGITLDRAAEWSELTGIPMQEFRVPEAAR